MPILKLDRLPSTAPFDLRTEMSLPVMIYAFPDSCGGAARLQQMVPCSCKGRLDVSLKSEFKASPFQTPTDTNECKALTSAR